MHGQSPLLYALSMIILIISYVYYKQSIFGLTREWFRELSFSRLECVVHDKLHISSTDWQTGATGDTVGQKWVGYQTLTET